MQDILVLSGVWSSECEEGKQSPQPPVLGQCCARMTSNRTALLGSQLASSPSGKVVTGSASCWLVDNIRQLKGGQAGCPPQWRSFAHIIALQGSSQHPAHV